MLDPTIKLRTNPRDFLLNFGVHINFIQYRGWGIFCISVSPNLVQCIKKELYLLNRDRCEQSACASSIARMRAVRYKRCHIAAPLHASTATRTAHLPRDGPHTVLLAHSAAQ
jgi:hypothetical protein